MTEHRIQTDVDDKGRLIIPAIGVEKILADLLKEIRGLRADLEVRDRKATNARRAARTGR